MVATRRRSNSRVTIADVAREAGVNKGTVSRALRGVPGVGQSTRQRILEAADRLDFSASHIATALATGVSQTVGVVIPNLKSWYFGEVAAGASEVLIPAGYRIELVNLDMDSDFLDISSPDFARLVTELGQGRGRDALLFAGNVADPGRDNTSGVAGVPVATPGDPATNVPGVVIDNQAGARMVAEHLISLGHQRLAVVDGRLTEGGDTRLWDQRTAGFAEGMAGAGLSFDDALLGCPGDCHIADGERAADDLLELLRLPDPPTAVFCHTDELAFGLISALRRHGVQCPDDISIAGFDDHPMSRYWGLTTINQYAHEQGARAAWALLDALDDSHAAAYEVVADWPTLTVQLVERESTRPL